MFRLIHLVHGLSYESVSSAVSGVTTEIETPCKYGLDEGGALAAVVREKQILHTRSHVICWKREGGRY